MKKWCTTGKNHVHILMTFGFQNTSHSRICVHFLKLHFLLRSTEVLTKFSHSALFMYFYEHRVTNFQNMVPFFLTALINIPKHKNECEPCEAKILIRFCLSSRDIFTHNLCSTLHVNMEQIFWTLFGSSAHIFKMEMYLEKRSSENSCSTPSLRCYPSKNLNT